MHHQMRFLLTHLGQEFHSEPSMYIEYNENVDRKMKDVNHFSTAQVVRYL